MQERRVEARNQGGANEGQLYAELGHRRMTVKDEEPHNTAEEQEINEPNGQEHVLLEREATSVTVTASTHLLAVKDYHKLRRSLMFQPFS